MGPRLQLLSLFARRLSRVAPTQQHLQQLRISHKLRSSVWTAPRNSRLLVLLASGAASVVAYSSLGSSPSGPECAPAVPPPSFASTVDPVNQASIPSTHAGGFMVRCKHVIIMVRLFIFALTYSSSPLHRV